MQAALSLKDILRVTEGKVINNIDIQDIAGTISTDTRKIARGDFFLALEGKNFDGHQFINIAYNQGVQAIIVSQPEINNSQINIPIILVKNTLNAYLNIATLYKEIVSPKTILITGSSGKTTTKEMVTSVLSTKYKVHKTFSNHNNEIGFCQTVLSMPHDTDILVLEAGMRNLGDIKLITEYAKPHIGVITNVGTAHIGILGSLDNVVKGKCELLENMSLQSTAVLFNQKNLLDYARIVWKGKTLIYGNNFECNKNHFYYKNRMYTTKFTGKHNYNNAVAAIEIGKLFNIPDSKILEAITNYEPIQGRGNNIKLANGLTIIDESYNANPESMKASLESLFNFYKGEKIGLVLGDMEELGETSQKAHCEIVNQVDAQNLCLLVTVGKFTKAISDFFNDSSITTENFSSSHDASVFITNYIKRYPLSVLMLKGSRSAKLENVLHTLLNA